MNIPSFPTDNLYKFMAIFGLIIFIVSVIYVRNTEMISTQTRLQLEEEADLIGYEVKILQERFTNLKNITDEYRKDVDKG